jgi:hypothetical protein
LARGALVACLLLRRRRVPRRTVQRGHPQNVAGLNGQLVAWGKIEQRLQPPRMLDGARTGTFSFIVPVTFFHCFFAARRDRIVGRRRDYTGSAPAFTATLDTLSTARRNRHEPPLAAAAHVRD